MDYRKLLRPNIAALKPYKSARSEFKGNAEIMLDANENPYDAGYARYPDPLQSTLKNSIAKIKEVDANQVFLGNGSDEIIDLFIRGFCRPGTDSILSLNPSYGMYKVSADINDVKLRKFNLDSEFKLNVDQFIVNFETTDKLIFLCTPNNPSGSSIPLLDIKKIADAFSGLVIVDEAYIDFSDEKSAIQLLDKYPNVVIMQTFSKSWGAAGLRIGMSFMNEELVKILNGYKPPYNLSKIAQDQAIELLKSYPELVIIKERIKKNKLQLIEGLSDLPLVKKVYPSDANFLLAKTVDANAIYQFLLEKGVVVRNRTNEYNCENCLRITVGTEEENEVLLNALKSYTDA